MSVSRSAAPLETDRPPNSDLDYASHDIIGNTAARGESEGEGDDLNAIEPRFSENLIDRWSIFGKESSGDRASDCIINGSVADSRGPIPRLRRMAAAAEEEDTERPGIFAPLTRPASDRLLRALGQRR